MAVPLLTGEIMHERPPIQIGLDINEAAGFLGLNNPTFMNLVKAGILPMPIDVAGTQVWQARRLSLWFNRLEERYSKAREKVIAAYDVI